VSDLLPTSGDVKHRMLMAAEEVFAEKGYTAATTREITEKAGVNIAAINYHFGDKERLYIATVRFAHESTGKHTPLAPAPSGTSPVEKLGLFIRELTMRMTTPARPTSLQLMMRELNHPTTAAREVVRDYIQPIAFRLWDIVRELDPRLCDQQGLLVGFSVIGQILFYRQNRTVTELIFGSDAINAISSAAIADHVTRFTLAALGHAAPLCATTHASSDGGAG
jgi:TetR/AcrR family transcriptional regulator, regulator of cefoperazone and chloramphenicol sensitivity